MIKCGCLEFYSRSKKYVPLRRFKGNTRYFKKKTEIVRDLIEKDVEDIKKLGVKVRIIVCTDCGYANKEMVDFLRSLGAYHILAIKGNTVITLKNKDKSVNAYFSKKNFKKRYIDGKTIYFAESNLNLKSFGQQRVFCIKTSKNGDPRFFICNLRKAKLETIIKIARRRWDDEQGHKDLKQYCGFRKRWTRKPSTQSIHYNLTYFLYNLLSVVRSRLEKLKELLSIGAIAKRFVSFSESLIIPVVDFNAFYNLFDAFGCW
jgi:hypothetical protein